MSRSWVHSIPRFPIPSCKIATLDLRISNRDSEGTTKPDRQTKGGDKQKEGLVDCNIPKIHLKKLLEIISKFRFVVELPNSPEPFPISVPTSESNHCPVSLFLLVPRVTPDRRACTTRRGRRRDRRRRDLLPSLSFSFSPPLFFFLFPFSFLFPPALSFLSSAALSHTRRVARRSPATALTPAAPRP